MKNNPANFKLRLLAGFTDTLIGTLIFVLCIYYVSQQPSLKDAFSALFLVTIAVFLNPLFIYYPVLFTYYLGATPGKFLAGIKVVEENNNKLSFKRVFFRQTIGYSFSWLVFGLGFFSIAKDPQKQGWHDKAVGSKVIVDQNHWFMAILACVAAIGFSVFFIGRTVDSFVKGPLGKEMGSLVREYQKEMQKEEKNKKIDESKFNTMPSGYPVQNPI